MKKILAVILAITSVAVLFASCGTKNDANTDTTAATNADVENSEVQSTPDVTDDTVVDNGPATDHTPLVVNNESVVVSAKDGFNNAGVVYYLCDTTADYAFVSDGDADWSIYVLDAPFEDGARYLSKAKTPALVGDGIIKIEEGKFIYIECSNNAFTAETPADAELEIFFPGKLSGKYQDSFSQRATATVIEESDDEGELHINIHWGSSATEATEWNMECEKAANGKYEYDNCEKFEVTENGSKLVYADGKGYFTLKDGKLLWDGAAEEQCKDCVFELSK